MGDRVAIDVGIVRRLQGQLIAFIADNGQFNIVTLALDKDIFAVKPLQTNNIIDIDVINFHFSIALLKDKDVVGGFIVHVLG